MKWVRHMADYSQKEKELEREHLEKLVKEEDRSIKPMKEFESPDDLYHELIASVRKYHPSADISLIEKAYHVARDAHEGQTRKSGEPYIVHPLCVAIILAELELDKETIAAGLLHDVLEDTVMTADEIKEEFSEEVLLLVDGVTKLRHLHLADNSHNHDQKDRSAAVSYTHLDVYKRQDKLWQNTVDLFRSLDIPVRTLECCSGDLADLKVKSCDVEAWSPRQKKYFEVGSCSNLGDAQARRLKIRVKGKDGSKYFAHTRCV